MRPLNLHLKGQDKCFWLHTQLSSLRILPRSENKILQCLNLCVYLLWNEQKNAIYKSPKEQGNENKLHVTRQYLLLSDLCLRVKEVWNVKIKTDLTFNKYCTNIAKKNTRVTKSVRLQSGVAESTSKQKSQAKTGSRRHPERQIYGTLWEFVMVKKGGNGMECFYHLWFLTLSLRLLL